MALALHAGRTAVVGALLAVLRRALFVLIEKCLWGALVLFMTL